MINRHVQIKSSNDACNVCITVKISPTILHVTHFYLAVKYVLSRMKTKKFLTLIFKYLEQISVRVGMNILIPINIEHTLIYMQLIYHLGIQRPECIDRTAKQFDACAFCFHGTGLYLAISSLLYCLITMCTAWHRKNSHSCLITGKICFLMFWAYQKLVKNEKVKRMFTEQKGEIW